MGAGEPAPLPAMEARAGCSSTPHAPAGSLSLLLLLALTRRRR